MPSPDDDLPGESAPETPVPAAVKKPAAAPAAEPPQKPRHTRKLIDTALALGYTQDDLDTFSSAELWEDIQNTRDLEEKSRPAPAVRDLVRPAPVEVDEDEEYLAQVESNPEASAFAKFLRRRLAKEKSAHEKVSKVDALEAAEQTRARRMIEDQIDSAFQALPEKYHALVGTESLVELTDPGQKGWRGEIFRAAKLDFSKDTAATIRRKIAASAAQLAKGKVPDDEVETEPANGYEALAGKKKATPKNPVNGRFTKEDFEDGALALAGGKKAGAANLSAVEQTRSYLRERGDPRGSMPAIEFDDDLPG